MSTKRGWSSKGVGVKVGVKARNMGKVRVRDRCRFRVRFRVRLRVATTPGAGYKRWVGLYLGSYATEE